MFRVLGVDNFDYGAKIKNTSYKSQADFHWDFFLKKTIIKNQINVIFQLQKYSIYHLGTIEHRGGCPIKGLFTDKKAF